MRVYEPLAQFALTDIPETRGGETIRENGVLDPTRTRFWRVIH